jgi:hypothetical protein
LTVVTLAASFASAAVQPATGQFPAGLAKYLNDTIKLTSDERSRLFQGAPVTRLLDSDATKEVAVFGAVWIDAPIARYPEAVKDIERFERGGGFKVTKKISQPPVLQDFAELRLPAEDVEDLRGCRVGSCELKLGEQALQRFQKQVDWKAPDVAARVDHLMRQLSLEYVTGYLEGGNERLAVYRDQSRPTFVAAEFRDMVDRMPELTTFMPDMRRYLLEFPKVTIPNATSFLYWQETDFGLKPTIRISHLTIQQNPANTVVASKMVYASHYFWTGIELRVLLPDPARGKGLWFITVNRSRSDGLSGFTGSIVRGRVRSEVQTGTQASLEATKRSLERAP